jgi:phosphate transport system substrate-binding protein
MKTIRVMQTNAGRHGSPAPRPLIHLSAPRGHRLLALIAAVAVVLAGCSDKNTPSAETVLQGKLVIKGSNTVGEELAPRLIAAYKSNHPGISIDLESKGTGTGFAALSSSQCDIAAASRVPTQEERALAASNHVDFNSYMIGSYAVAVVANLSNQVSNLSRDQVRDIFAGKIQNWKEVGGTDAPIRLCGRDPISGTYLGFRELAMEDTPYAAGIKTFTNYTGIVEAIAKEPGAIGYCSIDLTTKPGIKAISIRGVMPDALAVKESRYPLARVLRFYTDTAKESAAAKDFIQFVQSARGQEVVAEAGNISRP